MFTYFIGNALDADVQAHLNRCSGTSSEFEVALDNLVKTLKEDGLWSKIYSLNVLATTKADTLLNLKYADGAADYVISGSTGLETFGTNGIRLTNEKYLAGADGFDDLGISDYDNHSMVYFGDLFSTTPTWIATRISDTNYIRQSGASSTSFVLDCDAGDAFTIAADGPGFVCGSVVANDERYGLVDVTSGSDLTTHTTFLGAAARVRVGNDYAQSESGELDAEFGCWGIGTGLTSSEMTSYRNAIQAYMEAMGSGHGL